MAKEYQEQVPRLLLELGYLSMRTGLMAQARVLIEAAQGLRPGDPTPALFIGMLHFAQGQHADAERQYRQVLQNHDGNDLARACLAESLIAQKRVNEAEPLLNAVAHQNRDPNAVAFANGLLAGLKAGVFQRA